MSESLRKRYGKTDREVSSSMTRWVTDIAQRRAQRISLAQRKGVLQTDHWLDENLGFAGSDA